MIMITINSKNDMTFGTEFSTWIIAFCPDSDSWFVTNQRFWWYEYPIEFQSEQEGIYYFVSKELYFLKIQEAFMVSPRKMEVKMKINYILAGCVLAVGMLAVGAIALGIFTERSRSQNNTIENPMVKLYEDSNSTIWYDKDTMVMYYERNCTYCVEITVMVNADGTPKLYKEEN